MICINGKNFYKLGLHIHTTISDGRKTPEQMADIYKAAGYDAVAITDHWHYHPECEINGLRILSGCEYNVGGGDSIEEGVMHIVGVGMTHDPKVARDASRQEVIDAIRGAGGIAILAHPAWSLNSVEDILALEGLSAVEIFNSVSDVGQSNRPYSGAVIDLLANKGKMLPLIATDDVHYYTERDAAYSYTLVESESPDTRALLDAIESGHVLASQAPTLYTERCGDRITAHFTPAARVAFMSNIVWVADRICEGNGITSATYTVKPRDRWVRIEITDPDGKMAWSNFILP
jgi:histidinol phosphatase-like PHP family hydrolase